MTVIQLDGGEMVSSNPATESIGILYPGERFDALLFLNGAIKDSEHSLTITLDGE